MRMQHVQLLVSLDKVFVIHRSERCLTVLTLQPGGKPPYLFQKYLPRNAKDSPSTCSTARVHSNTRTIVSIMFPPSNPPKLFPALYRMMEESDVEMQAMWDVANQQLLQVAISWPTLGRSGLGVLVDIFADSQTTSFARPSCTSPGRDPPCYIARETVRKQCWVAVTLAACCSCCCRLD